MSILTRLGRLEAAQGGGCACPNPTEVRYYEGEDSQGDAARDTEPASICLTCGGARTLIKVAYEKARSKPV